MLLVGAHKGGAQWAGRGRVGSVGWGELSDTGWDLGVGGGLVRQGSVEWDSRAELERLGGEVWFWELAGS